MTGSISSTRSSNGMSSLRSQAVQMAGKQRPDLRNARSVTSAQVKSEIKSTTGVDVDAVARKVDADGDGHLTTSELARVESKRLSEAAERAGIVGDGKSAKAEVTARLDKVNSDRDANGDGKASKEENADYATKLAEQLDSQYTGMRLKGFSREDVGSQLGSVNAVGSRSSVMYGEVAYEYHKADRDGDGRINSTEGEKYVADKSGLSDDVQRVEEREKTEKEEKTEKSGETDEQSKSDKTAKVEQEKKKDVSYGQSDATVGRQLIAAQAYGSIQEGRRQGRLADSA